MSSQKIAIGIVWIASALASAFAGGIIGTIGSLVFGFLVIAHLIECFVFRKELEEAPGSMGSQLVQTFLFGVVHMQELRAAARSGTGGAAGGDA